MKTVVEAGRILRRSTRKIPSNRGEGAPTLPGSPGPSRRGQGAPHRGERESVGEEESYRFLMQLSEQVASGDLSFHSEQEQAVLIGQLKQSRLEERRCFLCHKWFLGGWLLKHHLVVAHCKKRFRCILCGELRSFATYSSLLAHQMKTHHTTACNFCETTFTTEAKYKSHDCPGLSAVEGAPAQRPKGPRQNRAARGKKGTARAVRKPRRHHLQQLARETGDLRFRDHVTAEEQVTLVQQLRKRFLQERQCFLCLEQFKVGSGLKLHLLSAHVKPRFHCVLCEKRKRVSRYRNLMQHQMAQHGKTGCQFCRQTFETVVQWKCHRCPALLLG